MRLVRTAAAAALCLLTVFFCACGGEQSVTFTGFSMGSVLSLRLYCEKAEGNALARRIAADTAVLDAAISATSGTGTMAELNRTGTAVFDETAFGMLLDAYRLCEESGGRLNIAMGRVTALWGFATAAPALPRAQDVDAALAHISLEDVVFDRAARRVTLKNGAALDPGAVGKGAGCDLAAARLRAAGVPAVVDFGGTVLVCGRRKDNAAWTVGIRDPFAGDGSYFATLTLRPDEETPCLFVSTSGSYEKTFTENGKTYHHILDPDTGYPVETALVSVSVVSPAGLVSDALSTALFVMGDTPDARRLLAAHGAEAVFVYRDGGVARTEGLRERFRLRENAAGFRLAEE